MDYNQFPWLSVIGIAVALLWIFLKIRVFKDKESIDWITVFFAVIFWPVTAVVIMVRLVVHIASRE